MEDRDPTLESSEAVSFNNLNLLRDYFRENFGVDDLSQITWAHAVNSEAEFADCLNDGTTMFIEADVGLSADGVPIMSHPPSEVSDLILKNMLERLVGSKQGIKLDFKKWAAVEPGLDFLNQLGLHQPVIINADILMGNGAAEPTVPAADFIRLCQEKFPNGILSLGWTTQPNQPYTTQNVDQMIETVNQLETVLFPVRASLVRQSWRELSRLMPADRPGWALSFWNAKEEPPDVDFISWLTQEAKPPRALYDLMDANKQPIPVKL